MNSLLKAVSKCLSNVGSNCEGCSLESEVGWMWMQLRLGFSVAFLMKDMDCALCEGGCREYRQGNLCNLFTRPWEAHKDEWEQGQLLFSHSSPNLYWQKFGSSNKNETVSGWRQTNWALLSMCACVCSCMCVREFACVILQLLFKKHFSIAEGLEASLSWRKIYLSSPPEPWLLT